MLNIKPGSMGVCDTVWILMKNSSFEVRKWNYIDFDKDIYYDEFLCIQNA